MALDGLARAFDAAGLDDVGIESALDKPVDSAGFFGDAGGFVVEDSDEFCADDFAFLLGLGDAGEFGEEALAGVDGDDVEAEFVAEILLHALKLVFAQHAVVDEDAGELRADGFVDQDGGDRGINSSREAADDVARADLLADGFDGGLDEVSRGPVAGGAADAEDKILDELGSERGVVNFRMKLHGPDAAFRIGDAGKRVRGDGGAMEAGRKLGGFVAVAHPHRNGGGQRCEQGR